MTCALKKKSTSKKLEKMILVQKDVNIEIVATYLLSP
jgi:hypothetical protein